MIKLAFLIRSLDCGGTERQLVTLAKALDKKIFDVTIITFYSGGMLEKELEDCRVRCVSLEKRGRWDMIGFPGRLAHHLRLLRPDVIHAYLDISNLLSVIAKIFYRRARIIWGVRNSDMELHYYDWLWRLSFRLERFFSRYADSIIVNSNAGRAYLLERGFSAEKITVIHNGIDTDLFCPDAEAGLRVRREWKIPEDAILVGMAGRLDPVKDHASLLRAVSILQKVRPDVCFVCVGNGTENHAERLYQLTGQLGLNGVINWVGMRSDMPAVYNAFDIHISSSQSEGFPNMIGEAMACAVPCVVTDAGDSALIVGDTGYVSPQGNPEALAAALLSCLEADRKVLGVKARRRIQERWSVKRLVEKTEKVIIAVTEK